MDTARPKDAPANDGAPLTGPAVAGPRQRVSEMQDKLHRWAAADPARRFDDLFNFVYDPATLIVAFDRVAGNRGASVRVSELMVAVPGLAEIDLNPVVVLPEGCGAVILDALYTHAGEVCDR